MGISILGTIFPSQFPWPFFFNSIFFQISEAHDLIPFFWNSTSLWRRTICPMMFCWYMSDLCQFSLSFCPSQSLPIPNRKISLLISPLVHPRNNHISPRVCVCVCVCVCMWYLHFLETIKTYQGHTITSICFFMVLSPKCVSLNRTIVHIFNLLYTHNWKGRYMKISCNLSDRYN